MVKVLEFNWEELPPEEFAELGLEELAYFKAKPVKGNKMYAIHTGDGNEVAVVNGRELAFATIFQNELEPGSVH